MPSDDLPSRKVNPGPGGQGRSHYVVGARGIKIVEELSARGCHLTTIARALRMSKDALQACRARQPEVEEAYQRGLASAVERFHDLVLPVAGILEFIHQDITPTLLVSAKHICIVPENLPC